MSIYGYQIGFDIGFEDYDDTQQESIIKALNDKYTDFPEIVKKNYEKMKSRYTESFKSKLNDMCGTRSIWFELQYPQLRDDGSIAMVMIMFADGKGGKTYYNSIGKFNVKLQKRLEKEIKEEIQMAYIGKQCKPPSEVLEGPKDLIETLKNGGHLYQESIKSFNSHVIN
jgi:hypothetical protein